MRPGRRTRLCQPLVGLKVGGQIRQVHIEVAIGQERLAKRIKGARLVPAEVIGENQIQRCSCLWLVFVVPVRVVPAAAGATCSAVRPNRKKFSSPASSAISMVAPSRVPMVMLRSS